MAIGRYIHTADQAWRALVAKEEWGVKRQCLSCGARFYDLKKDPIVCPKCETVLDTASLLKSNRWQGSAARQEAPKKEPEKSPPKTEDDLDEKLDDDGDDDLDDDDANDTLLADDDEDEDMSDVFTPPAKSADGD